MKKERLLTWYLMLTRELITEGTTQETNSNNKSQNTKHW